MKFDIPKVVKPLNLSEYAPEYGTYKIMVWVNPPREKIKYQSELLARAIAAQKLMVEIDQKQVGEHEGITKSAEDLIREIGAVGDQMVEWFAEIWSQGIDAASHWSADDVRKLVEGSRDTDPQLWSWLTGKTIAMIREHRAAQKKA